MSSESPLVGLRRIGRLFALASMFFLACGVALAADKAAVKTLSEVPLFAFGGIGAAGITSNGEIAFRNVFSSDTAEADFLQVLKTGTPQAQCYALVGLRLKNRAAFDEQMKQFTASKKQVNTCAGCILGTAPMQSVVANIERGTYDIQVTAKPRPR